MRKAVSYPTTALSLSVDDHLELERTQQWVTVTCASRHYGPYAAAFPRAKDIFLKYRPFMVLFRTQWFGDSSHSQVKPTLPTLLTLQGPAWGQPPPPASASPHALPTHAALAPQPWPPSSECCLQSPLLPVFRTTQMAPPESGARAPSAPLSRTSLAKFHSGANYLGLQALTFLGTFQPSART